MAAVDLDAHRPHFLVKGKSAAGSVLNQYVFPEKLADDIAAGDTEISALPDDVWRTIIGQWSEAVRRGLI